MSVARDRAQALLETADEETVAEVLALLNGANTLSASEEDAVLVGLAEFERGELVEGPEALERFARAAGFDSVRA